jgi:hypothetical protein
MSKLRHPAEYRQLPGYEPPPSPGYEPPGPADGQPDRAALLRQLQADANQLRRTLDPVQRRLRTAARVLGLVLLGCLVLILAKACS